MYWLMNTFEDVSRPSFQNEYAMVSKVEHQTQNTTSWKIIVCYVANDFIHLCYIVFAQSLRYPK